jgi:low affinity Fe/Cu permease
MRPTKSTSWFTRFAKWTARETGRPATFVGAVSLILGWACTGPLFGFSDTWQLVINTGTTIITFLMVFLIQNTQNRDAEAIQVKLDELIRAMEGAHNGLLDLEELEEEELDRIRAYYERLAEHARADLRHGLRDTGVPDVEEPDTPDNS